MISNAMFVGIIFQLIISVAVPIGCIIYCIKKAGTKGIPFIILLGLVTGYFANNVIRFASIYLISKQVSGNLFILTLFLAVITAGCFMLARVFVVNYVGKTEVGLYKGLALGTGIAAGHILMQASEYYTNFINLGKMNAGTFLDTYKDQGEVIYEQAQYYQERMIAMNPAAFFIDAIQQFGLVFFHIALILILVKYFFVDRNKSTGIFITSGINVGYEFFSNLLNNLGNSAANSNSNPIIFMILSAILSILIAVGSIVCIFRLMKVLPKEKAIEFDRSKQKKQAPVNSSEKRAWQEVKQLNTRNINHEDEKDE